MGDAPGPPGAEGMMLPTPSDPDPLTLTLARGPVTYSDEGRGPVVVLVHGLPGSHRDFRYLAGALSGRVRLVRPDMPGFGSTPRRHLGSDRVASCASFLLRFADALGLPPALWIGHSMGGPVVLEVARRSPDRVRAVGLLASPGLRPHRSFRVPGIGLVARALAVPGVARLVAAPLARGYERAGFPSSLSQDARTHALRQAGRLGFRAQRGRIGALQCPTLVSWAEDDRLVEAAVSRELSRACPAGPRLWWDEGGHNIQKTHAAALAEAIATLAADVAR